MRELSRLHKAKGTVGARPTITRLPLLVVAIVISLASVLIIGFASAETKNNAIQSGLSSSPPSSPGCGLAWRVVPSSNPSGVQNTLFGVASISANDAWAVGSYSVGITGKTLALHWDGTQWNRTQSVNLSDDADVLQDVEAASSNDVWAVGYSIPSGPTQPLIEHWDGTQWSGTLIPFPNGGDLKRLAVVSPTDVWAVGYKIEVIGGGGSQRTLTMHWDGINWTMIPSPNAGPTDDQLWGVSAIAANDIWAVGLYYQPSQGAPSTLAMHWDGSTWSIVPAPSPGHDDLLSGVSAVTPDDVWATGNSNSETLTIHWDGSQWSQVPSPNSNGDSGNFLFEMTAVNDDAMWTVGYSCCPGLSLMLHWDGSAWSIVQNPNPGAAENLLFDTSATSGQDVWTVGSYDNCMSCTEYGLIERYSDPCSTPTPTVTGTPPTHTPRPTRTSTSTPTSTFTPLPCIPNTIFSVVTATATIQQGQHDIGNHCDDCTTTITLPFSISLYDLTTSTINVSSNGNLQLLGNNPDPSYPSSCLPAYSFNYTIFPYWTNLSTGQGGGIYTEVTGIAPNRTYIIEWRGCFVTPEYCAGYANFEVLLHEGSPDQHFDVAYGQTSGGQNNSIVIGVQKGTGSCITEIQCDIGTHPPQYTKLTFTLAEDETPTPTITSTSTATATATPCSITFSDVARTDYFYEGVSYLYCHEDISGYSDNTFRPYLNVTRGQVTKIVTLAQGWPLVEPPNPTFSDVPIGSTFYEYIETAFSRGIIGGYSDGTFRPNNNATRGQISKIVVLAEGWQLIDPPNATFSDVPIGSTFFEYVEAAHGQGIINGYPDGTFRPNNNATRGQLAKIVFLAITTTARH